MMAQICDRIYSVRAGRGYMQVTVTMQAIEYRGERRAVARVAWCQLMGIDHLDEVVQKRSPTRAYLASHANATQRAFDELFEQFMDSIQFTYVRNSWRET